MPSPPHPRFESETAHQLLFSAAGGEVSISTGLITLDKLVQLQRSATTFSWRLFLDNQTSVVTTQVVNPPTEYTVQLQRESHSLVANWTAGTDHAQVGLKGLIFDPSSVSTEASINHDDLEAFCIAYLDQRGYGTSRKVNIADHVRRQNEKLDVQEEPRELVRA